MKIIAVYHIKGGVGKTAAAVNLAYLASRSRKSILIDLDPQASASFYYRMKSAKALKGKKLMSAGKKIRRSVKGTDYTSLDALPASLSYRKLDLVLDGMKKSRSRLKRVLRPLAKNYDLVFLDCPPNITLLSENIFFAADLILVPLIPTVLSVMTYEQLIRFFGKHGLKAGKLRPFFSMAEKRKKLHREIMHTLMQDDDRFFSTVIPYSSDVEKMGLQREPLPAYNPNCRASRAYSDLWDEVARTAGE